MKLFCCKCLNIGLLLTAAPACAGLVAHLPLDAASNVILAGKAVFVDGVIGKAVALRPSSEGLVMEAGELGLKLSNAVSIGCWFKAGSSPGEELVVVEAGGCRLAVAKGGGNASFAVEGVKGSLAGIAAARRASGYSDICDGQWHQLAGLYDGQVLALYVDGVMEELLDASGPIAGREMKVVLGKTIQPANTTTCCIDDINIYDEALAYDTILHLAGGKARKAEPVAARHVDLHRDFLDKGVFPIQAHRGGGLALPEHTLETYRETWAMGLIPEADIRTTAEGMIICVHDNDLKRVAPAAPAPLNAMPFEKMTLERIKTLDVGAFRGRPGQKVPTLEEVFLDMQGHPERMLELDYKQIELGQLASLIGRYGLKDQVVFVTRRHHLIRQWQRVCPQATTMLWLGGTEPALDRMFEQLRRDGFAGISIVQIIVFKDTSADGFRPSVDYLRQRRSELAERGIALQLIPWEMASQAVFEKLLSAGFRFFGTDYPQTALESYRRILKQAKP